eukprot:gene10635-22202_t
MQKKGSPADAVECIYAPTRELGHPNNSNQKISSEISRLRTWIQKHQGETVPDGAKTKLMTIVEKYYVHLTSGNNSAILDIVTGLLSDLLSLPEGKLISAKGKSRLLKWLQSLNKSNSDEPKVDNHSLQEASVWVVADICDNTGALTLMKPDVDSNELIEDVIVHDNSLLIEIRRMFEEEEYVAVELDSSRNVIRTLRRNQS